MHIVNYLCPRKTITKGKKERRLGINTGNKQQQGATETAKKKRGKKV